MRLKLCHTQVLRSHFSQFRFIFFLLFKGYSFICWYTGGLVQEIGRAGRDGLPVSSCVLYHGTDLSGSKKKMAIEVRQYCRTVDCRRKFLSDYFGYEYQEHSIAHLCCDNCSSLCKCDVCIVHNA
jgi:hypothetical protein